ncbi:hypothetical protein D9756_001350 [Leucocoprinus leucothites]|uniref:adenosine deaminase n=1 Tax=Leucocoprinus leucothites TaxID=201217 RepID=A0A8H5G430_9AGAR|nr:hypothetical protein D9756_001350 [Leucoagaricus leucothites]
MSPSVLENKVDYLKQREELIDADRALRRDRLFAESSSALKLEREADKVVRRIRAEEAVGVWKEDHLDVPHPFPGMEFLTGKGIIERTKIFKILSRMPKGALLHTHIGASGDPRVLLQLALKYSVMHVRVPERLTSANIGSSLPQFMAFPDDSVALEGLGITSTDYVPNSWVNVSKARDLFDTSLGGPEGFDQWVINGMTIRPAEAYGTHNTVEKIWKKFQSTFTVLGGLIRFLPIFKGYIKALLLSSVNDGIFYLEPRCDFFFANGIVTADGKRNVTSRDIVQLFEKTVHEVKEELRKEGRGDKFLGARMIYTAFKAVSPENLYWFLDDCISLKKQFPHLIAGFDLVGHEDTLRPIIDYIEPLLYFRKRQAEEGVEIPFIFHAGETLGDGNAADSNVYDAILLGSKRIGHGYSLVKHPKLMQMCRERNILLEVCPVSNEILRLTSSMPMHPLPIVLNNGIPVALGPDDPLIFGNAGLTYDFFQVLVASEINGLTTLSVLARDSILFSMMPPEEKSKALAIWEAEWKLFLEHIVFQYK